MRRLARGFLLAAILGASASAAVAQGDAIVPGQSIGPLHLGQHIRNVVASLGPLYEERALPDSAFAAYFWPQKQIGAVVAQSTGKIVALAVTLDDTYRTRRGIAIGMLANTVQDTYGPPDARAVRQSVNSLIYDTLGIAFEIDNAGVFEGRVSGIFIFLSGHAHEIFSP